MSEGWIGLICDADACYTYPATKALRQAATIEDAQEAFEKKKQPD